MTEDEINGIVSDLFRDRFADFGFERATVQTEEDFDGGPILRVTVHFTTRDVPSDRLIDAIQDIRTVLLRRGEQRFVVFSSLFPHDQKEFVDEDED